MLIDETFEGEGRSEPTRAGNAFSPKRISTLSWHSAARNCARSVPGRNLTAIPTASVWRCSTPSGRWDLDMRLPRCHCSLRGFRRVRSVRSLRRRCLRPARRDEHQGGVDGFISQIGTRNRVSTQPGAEFKGTVVHQAAVAFNELGVDTALQFIEAQGNPLGEELDVAMAITPRAKIRHFVAVPTDARRLGGREARSHGGSLLGGFAQPFS